ncbi:MAG: acyl-CoA dehydrogenase family protein [Bacteroidia bacterium]|nr:acyl-CoA dehydrogenase family protein [Bacteroidia bacterium]
MKNNIKGGEFLIKNQEALEIYIPEDMNEEQGMFRSMIMDFLSKEVNPLREKIDKQRENPDLIPQLMIEAGKLGMLSASLPEEYGGMSVDFNTETLLSEDLGTSQSFSVAVAAHTGIGTLPFLYYGSEEQKRKYLPGLGDGSLKAAYCLTEPNSGSDALSAKTKAVLEGDNWVLNGGKMWITNGGFADIFTVFAQVDGDKFTAFIVERDTPGLKVGQEEVKLGIKGSSTCQVFLENVKIPKDNLLGEIGKGHKIAFNVLNIGRFKLCAMVMGACKRSIDISVKYANERHQFGGPISSFGAIQQKIADMAIYTYATESATYRVSGLIQDKISFLVSDGMAKPQSKLIAAEEYSVECALLKVLGSESLDFVIDEAVQIFGGTGYSEEYPVASMYRDARINRIFEGTNEINRMLAVGQILKKAMKGKIDLMGPAMKIQEELMEIPDFEYEQDEVLYQEKKSVVQAKKAILMLAGAAAKKYMLELENKQEILMNLADMLIQVFTAESTVLRTGKLVNKSGVESYEREINMTKCYVNEAMEKTYLSGKHLLAELAEDDMLVMMNMGLKRFTKYPILNTISLKKKIASVLIEKNTFY